MKYSKKYDIMLILICKHLEENEMAGGEKAKSSGEYGERIVDNLLSLIGWKNILSGVTVKCMFSEKHKDKSTESQKHGIDNVFQYKCPLRDSVQHDVLVSVKCRKDYPTAPSTITANFKNFLIDLARAAECYPSSDIYRRKIPKTTKREISGVVFWINRNIGDGKEYECVIDKVTTMRLGEDVNKINITLVDNKRAQFLFDILTYANKKYGEEKINFFYIGTGLNNISLDRVYKGKVMPVEYLSANVIPLVVENGCESMLLLVTSEPFCESYLRRLIGVAQEITNTLAASVEIIFSDYNKFEHEEIVKKVKFDFEDESFLKKVSVVTYKIDFRDEV